MKTLGRHVLTEFYGCKHKILDNIEEIKSLMEQAALFSGATIIDSRFHRFNPHGVSGVVIIAESHLAIHTWPEFDYASIDIYTCGTSVDPWKAYQYLKDHLNPRTDTKMELMRGSIEESDTTQCHRDAEAIAPRLIPITESSQA
ncbi:MAG: S-adenosylmethionine decarboxylase proenzyme [Deltaproteobacteria bacterium]|nr:MAG: S-adenosylmethionine decarboxylase proenzyme [Deltaproteobacteria bacterium]